MSTPKKPPPSPQTLSSKAILYMFLLALQFGMQPILTKRFTPQSVNRSSVVIMQESIKFCLAISMLFSSGKWSEAVKGWTIGTWISVAGVPAALYCIQNMAVLLSTQHLDPLTFNVLNQTKTLSAALCCYLIIGRRQSHVQVFSLFLLLVSALIIEKIVTLDMLLSFTTSSKDDSPPTPTSSKHWTHGVAPVLLASFISGLAGALTQKNLQGGGRNALLFSTELCVASLIFLSLSLLSSNDGVRMKQDGFFQDLTPYVLIPIVVNAIGGILVGLVTKYAGSVKKGFALIFGILLSGLVQAETEGVSKEQIVGGVLAALSLWMHSVFPYVAPSKKMEGVVNGHKKEIGKKPSRKGRKED